MYFLLSVALATGLENSTVTCNPPFDDIMTGDVLRWFFTRTTIDNTNNNMIDMSNTNKYGISGARDSKLTVNNVNSSDEGYYYCRIYRNGAGGLLPTEYPGACLDVYSKSK